MVGTDFGLGIAFALNQPMNSTVAEIVDQADVTTATNINVSADGMHDLDAEAIGGTVSSDSAAINLNVALTVPQRNEGSTKRLRESVGTPTLSLTGDLDINANHMAMIDALSDSVALGSTPVGISLAIAAGRDETTALLSRDVSAGGNVEVQSHAGTISNVKGVALASGAEDEGSPAREIANDQLMEVGAQRNGGNR